MNEEMLKLIYERDNHFKEYLDTPLGWRIKALHDSPNKLSPLFDIKDVDRLYCNNNHGFARPYSIEDSEYGSYCICDDGKGGFRPATITIVTWSNIEKDGKKLALRKRQCFDHRGKFPRNEQINQFLAENATTGFLFASMYIAIKASEEALKALSYELHTKMYKETALAMGKPEIEAETEATKRATKLFSYAK